MNITNDAIFDGAIHSFEKRKKSSSPSTVKGIGIIEKIGDSMYRDNEKLVFVNKDRSLETRFIVASTPQVRERAYRLAYRAYKEIGLVDEIHSGMVISPFDYGPEMFTLLAEDQNGENIGTISLVFDSAHGFPCNDIYEKEVGDLRRQGRKLVEVVRLVVKKESPCARDVLWRLFNLSYIYATWVRRYTDFVIEVNPRHAPYYEKKLLFKTISAKKCCPRVENAPAVLARLDLKIPARELKHAGKTGPGRTLYPYGCSLREEKLVAEHLHREYDPMTEEEIRRFEVE